MCGIIGIIGQRPISELIHIGMLQLQHRGQEAAGVFLYDPVENLHLHRTRPGLVSNLFATQPPVLSTALWGIGHTRYATSGRNQITDAQPLFLKHNNGWLSLAHNGNIVNYSSLRKTLENKGILFQTSCDTEALLHLLAQNLPDEGPFFENLCLAIQKIHMQVTGAYSIIGIMTGHGMFAFRDPKGIRPLLFGKGENGYAFASETLALTNTGCQTIEDVLPGEVIFIDIHGALHRKVLTRQRHSHCCFEFNYFAKPHTVMDGKEVYSVRSKLGHFLAEKIIQAGLASADVVVPIPETGIVAGIATAQHLQIPFAAGFSKLTHAGRIFIMTGQERREGALLQKLAPIRSVFENKSVILVDDSIVRGTVSKRIIFLARQAGARRITFASTFPPILHPCVYGVDFPCHDQLIARNKTIPEICEEIGADALIYNDIQSLKEAIGLDDLCLACLTGRYPTSTEGIEVLQQLREQELSSLV